MKNYINSNNGLSPSSGKADLDLSPASLHAFESSLLGLIPLNFEKLKVLIELIGVNIEYFGHGD